MKTRSGGEKSGPQISQEVGGEFRLEIDRELGPYNSEVSKWVSDLLEVSKALGALQGQTNNVALSRVLIHLEEAVREMSERLPKMDLSNNNDERMMMKDCLEIVENKLLDDNYMARSREVAAEEVEKLRMQFFKN